MTTEIALVTGASRGIGEALARRLAADLRARHGIEVHPIALDLIAPGAAERLVGEVERRGLTVDWLVNNAGFGTTGRFDRLPVAREVEEIRLNVEVPVELAGRFLPGMVARGRGAVINVASLAAYGPMAYSATYAATKAFLLSFSEAIAAELAGTGVHVLCVCPGFTRTEFQEKARVDTRRVPGLAWMTAEEVADQTVRAVGRTAVLVNGTLNSLTSIAMRLVPRGLIARTTARVLAPRA